MLPDGSSQLLDASLLRLLVAGALGLLLGLEREWSRRPAGVRTFALIGLLGALFTSLDRSGLVLIGALLVVLQGTVLTIRGLIRDEGLLLTTAISMLVTYGVGVLAGSGRLVEAVTVAVLGSLVLVLKRELHDFAWGLSHEELRATVEFCVLAFVIYPLLPAGTVPLRAAGITVDVEPRVVWLLVVAVAGIGIVNYAVVKAYGGTGVAITGFFAGLVSSTAVVGTMLDHVRRDAGTTSYAVAAILLADAAMALRNLALVATFTLPRGVPIGLVVPLALVAVGGIAVALLVTDRAVSVEVDLESPFSLRNVLGFGALFAVIVVGSGLAAAAFGDAGVVIAAALGGLASSASATASAVLLYRAGTISADLTVLAVTSATLASIAVKASLAVAGPSGFGRRVVIWSFGLAVLAMLALFVPTAPVTSASLPPFPAGIW